MNMRQPTPSRSLADWKLAQQQQQEHALWLLTYKGATADEHQSLCTCDRSARRQVKQS